MEPVASMEQMVAWPVPAAPCLGVLAIAAINPDPDALDASADELAVNLLQMFGQPREKTREIVGGQLPKASRDPDQSHVAGCNMIDACRP